MQNYNQVISVKVIDSDTSLLVSVAEMKTYMRLEGFQDVDESISTPFEEDDDLIEDLIKSATKKLEQKYGISLVNKILRATITNLAGDIELPQGPVIEVTELLDRDGNEIEADDYTLVGDDFIQLECPRYEKMKITYEAGYEEVPEPLIMEIKRMVSWMFEHRGEEDGLKGFVYSTGEYDRNPFIW